MNKKALLALLMAVCMLMSSCALVVKNEAVDAATPIVTVGDKVFTKAEVQQQVAGYLNYMADMYQQQYGYSIDTTNASVIESAQETVANMLIEQTVKEQKMAELGLDTLTDEETAEIDEEYQSWYDLVASMLGEDESMTEEERTAYIDSYIYYVTGANRDTMIAAKKEENLKAAVVKDVTVTEDEIKAAYDVKVEEAKTSYENNLSAYGTAVNNGNTVYYRPAGYRMVKNLLIKLLDKDSELVDGLNAKATEQATAMNTAKIAIEATEGADLEALTAQVTVSTPIIVDTVEPTVTDEVVIPTYTADVTDTFDATEDEAVLTLQQKVRDYALASALNQAYAAAAASATDSAFETIDGAADGVLAELDAGADWDTVMAINTEDPGMQGDAATAKTGYAVCEGFSSFDVPFVEAAMSIPEVGGHSGKVRGAYGYYIIQYASAVEEGAVDLADVKDVIEAEQLTQKQNEFYTKTIADWVAAANAKIDLKSLND